MAAQPTNAKLPRGASAASREEVAASQRSRLLAALKQLAATDGYPSVTIAAIVREAGVAKPTFYEHFADKEDCFLQLIDGCWADLLGRVVASIAPDATPAERIDPALDCFLDYFAADEQAARLLLIETLQAGEAAAARLSDAHLAIAAVYRASREDVRSTQRPELPPISEARALAIVGAVNEPIVALVRDGRAAELPTLRDELRTVVNALAFATP